MESFLTAKQVEELLNVDRTTIYRMIKDGRLTGVKIGKHWRFPVQDVEELLGGSEDRSENLNINNVTDSLPVHCMQPIQNVFAEIARIGAVTTDKEGKPITKISNACDFCKLILGSDEGREACQQSWKLLVDQKGDQPEFIRCHAGLEYARARIQVGGELVGILVSGQFYLESPDEGEEEIRIKKLSSKYQINYDILKFAAKKITVLEERQTLQISGWLEQVAKTFEQISSERIDLMTRLKHISKMSEI